MLTDSTHRSLAIYNSATVSTSTSPASTIQATCILRSGPLRVEATVGSAPHSSLPICANGEILLLAGLQLEAAKIWLVAGLGHDARVDDLVAEVAHDEGLFVLGFAGNVVDWSALHVVDAGDRLGCAC